MNLYSTIKLLSLVFHAALGLYALWKNPKNRLNQAFSVAVLSIAFAEFGYLVLLLGSDRLSWMRIALTWQCLASANMVFLSLVYGRDNYRDSLKAGRFYLVAIYLASLVLIIAIAFGVLNIGFSEDPASAEASAPAFPGESEGFAPTRLWAAPRSGSQGFLGDEHHPGLMFDRRASLFIAFLLICTLVALVNLENTYRQVRQAGRRLKYPILVLIGSLAFHLLIYSLGLGFSYIRMDVLTVASITLVVANSCLVYPVIRPEPVGARVYVSRAVMAKSYTLLLAGIYLLIIGLLGKIIQIVGKNLSFFLAFLVAFFVLLVIMAVILSRSIKQRFQLFIERNFYRNRYDYRKEWENFSRRVSSILSMKDLLKEVINTVSETVGTDVVTIMLLDEHRSEFLAIEPQASGKLEQSDAKFSISAQDTFADWLWRYGKPIRVNDGQLRSVGTFGDPPDISDSLLSLLRPSIQNLASQALEDPQPLGKLDQKNSDLAQPLKKVDEDGSYSVSANTRKPNARVADTSASGILVPIIADQRLMAIMVIGPRETPAYSQEDIDLLETMANQIAVAVVTAQTSQELAISRELESFYKLSTMMLHDLKSSAAMLSLVIQNAADNFDNPEFQRDALSTISNVAGRIQKLIRRLSAAPREMEFAPNPRPTDLAQIVSGAVSKSGVRNLARIELVEELRQVRRIMVDPESMETAILNLILNAIEAIQALKKLEPNMRENGTITIRTRQASDGYVHVSVGDTGCGMSQEFIREKLFQPFQTTKERGLGIGLYQCKTIVEASGGVIEVESHEGTGTTFTIRLPIQEIQGKPQDRGYHKQIKTEVTR